MESGLKGEEKERQKTKRNTEWLTIRLIALPSKRPAGEKNRHSLVHALPHKLRADPPDNVLDDRAVQLRDGIGRNEVGHLFIGEEKRRERDCSFTPAVESSFGSVKAMSTLLCLPLCPVSHVRGLGRQARPLEAPRKETEKHQREEADK